MPSCTRHPGRCAAIALTCPPGILRGAPARPGQGTGGIDFPPSRLFSRRWRKSTNQAGVGVGVDTRGSSKRSRGVRALALLGSGGALIATALVLLWPRVIGTRVVGPSPERAVRPGELALGVAPVAGRRRARCADSGGLDLRTRPARPKRRRTRTARAWPGSTHEQVRGEQRPAPRNTAPGETKRPRRQTTLLAPLRDAVAAAATEAAPRSWADDAGARPGAPGTRKLDLMEKIVARLGRSQEQPGDAQSSWLCTRRASDGITATRSAERSARPGACRSRISWRAAAPSGRPWTRQPPASSRCGPGSFHSRVQLDHDAVAFIQALDRARSPP